MNSLNPKSSGQLKTKLRVLFSPETPQGTLTILAIVTLFLAAAGAFYIKLSDTPKPERYRSRFLPDASKSQFDFQIVNTEITCPISLSAGLFDSFFLLSEKKLSCLNILESENEKLTIRESSSLPLEKVPTASHFVRNPSSPLYGFLLIAFSNELYLYNPEQKSLTVYAVLDEGVKLTGLAADSVDIFAADAANGVVHRINSAQMISEIGLPDSRTGFTGFAKGIYPFFDLDVDTETETIYVTHPDQFRVEAFSALNGDWIPSKSWEKIPQEGASREGYFSGKQNPATLMVLGDSVILTSDAGSIPDIQCFRTDGSFLVKIAEDAVKGPMTESEAPLTAITQSESNSDRLLILMPDGQLIILTTRPIIVFSNETV